MTALFIGMGLGFGGLLGTRLISGITETNAGAPSTNQFTVCFNEAVVVTIPTSGVTFEVDTVPTAITFVEKSIDNKCFTYQLSAGVWADGEALVFCIDNSGGEWTSLATGLPINDTCTPVVNLYNAPVALSAVVIGGGANTLVVTFDVPVTDAGGDVTAHNCTQDIALTLSDPTGNGTTILTYVVEEFIYVGDEVKWSSAGIPTGCVGEAFIPTSATFGGSSALSRSIPTNSESNEGTISLWFRADVGTGVVKLYDIGNQSGVTNETTRLRIDGSGQLDAIISHWTGVAWELISSVLNMPVGGITEDEWHHIYLTFKNDQVDGLGTQVIEFWYDGAQLGSSTLFLPTPDTTVSFLDSDNVVIGARRDYDQGFTGSMAEIWSAPVYLDPTIFVPKLYSSTTGPGFVNGLPINLGTGIVSGVLPTNHLGGPDYTLADWNSGVNLGTTADFVLVGDPLT